MSRNSGHVLIAPDEEGEGLGGGGGKGEKSDYQRYGSWTFAPKWVISFEPRIL